MSAAPIWAIVPVKPFAEAKSRLAPLIPRPALAHLAARLLQHTLEVLRASSTIDRFVVTSRDAAGLSIAREAGALPVPERGGRGLNSAVRKALMVALDNQVAGVLLIASDLPLLAGRDIDLLLEAAARADVVLAPDRHGAGTNALYLRPPNAISPEFGADSFARHFKQARAAGIQPAVVRSQALGFDLDMPSDYLDLQTIAPGEWDEATLTAAFVT